MNCSLQQDGSLLFQEIDSFLAELILKPFQQPAIDTAIVTQRFFQKLNEENPPFAQDWKEYIAPELQHLFLSCHEVALKDLASLQKQEPEDRLYTLTIPLAHRDAWLRMLSMVRLSLTSHYNFCDEEFQKKDPSSLFTPRGKALLQMELFAVIQQCLIEAEG